MKLNYLYTLMVCACFAAGSGATAAPPVTGDPEHPAANQKTNKHLLGERPSPAIERAHKNLARGRTVSAHRDAEKLLADNPNDVEALLVLANLHIRKEQWAQAQQYFEQALTINANHPAATLGLANVLLVQGQRDDAERVFTRYQTLTQETTP